MDPEINSLLSEVYKYKQKTSFPKNELNQHLVELGYLKVEKLQLPGIGQLRENALDSFRKELIASGILSTQEIESIKLIQAEEADLFFLRMLKDVDEGVVFKMLPNAGRTSLKSRLIHYRLDIIGLFEGGAIEMPFGDFSILKLQELAKNLGISDLLSAINAMADMENLTKIFVDHIGKENCILIFKLPNVTEKLRKFERKEAFKRTLKDDFSRKSEFFQKVKDTVLKKRDKKVDYPFLDQRVKADENVFLLRLIQVHQWMDGFYKGLLDSDLGEVSFNSILDTVSFFNSDDEEDDIKAKEVLFHAGKGYFVFNALFFLEKYMIEEEKKDYQKEVVEMLNRSMENASPQDRVVFDTESEKITESALSENDEPARERKGLLQRVYYGVKSFFKKAFKVGKRIFRWIKDKVQKVAGFLKEFFKKMFVHLRKALYYIGEGVKYIIGQNPLIKVTPENQVLATKILIDGDANCIVSRKSTRADIVAFRKQTSLTIGSMVFSLKVITLVIKTVQQMLTFFTWPLLLLNIVNAFKETVTEYKLLNSLS